jgi:glycosyltransferase involved in cell wall biosynthesis
MEPLAICVPTYNRSATLRALLDTLAADAPHVPVLVSDNASPDDTAAVLAAHAHPNLTVHTQAENIGPVANIRWLLRNAPEARHVWLLCDDDLPEPDAIERVQELLATEDPAWLHLPHRWVNPAGEAAGGSRCPATLERYPDAGALWCGVGHWLTFGSASILRRDLLATAAATVDTQNAYAPLVWFAHAGADGPCVVAPFCAVVGGTEITWADRAEAYLTEDFPALYEEVFAPRVDAAAFAATLDALYIGQGLEGIWRSRTRERIAETVGRFPAARSVRLAAVERAVRDADAGLLALVRTAITTADREEARAAHEAGVAAYEQGDAAAAEGMLVQSLYADPAEAEAWSDLGVIRHASGRRVGAIEALRVATWLDPADEDARANLEALARHAA